jgi:sphingosine kinase
MFNSHAKDLAKSLDLSQFDGIVCVSGDGVLVEVKKNWSQIKP